MPKGSCKWEEFHSSKCSWQCIVLVSYHKTPHDQNTPLKHLLPPIHCLSQVLYTLSWRGQCFSSLCPQEGQAGLTQSRIIESQNRYVEVNRIEQICRDHRSTLCVGSICLPLPLSTVSLVLCVLPLSAQSFLLIQCKEST